MEIRQLQTSVIMTPLEEEIGHISRKSRAVTLAATAMCRLYGPRPGCLCSNEPSRCHAAALYGDFALAAVATLAKAELLK
jgi:hypothetical protein